MSKVRPIDANALCEAMYHEAFETDTELQKWDSGCWIRYKMFEKAIDNAPTLDTYGTWISCEERLPSESDYKQCYEICDGAVLWCSKTGVIGMGWYYESTKRWSDLWDNEVANVIAWMPLPKPYERSRR